MRLAFAVLTLSITIGLCLLGLARTIGVRPTAAVATLVICFSILVEKYLGRSADLELRAAKDAHEKKHRHLSLKPRFTYE